MKDKLTNKEKLQGVSLLLVLLTGCMWPESDAWKAMFVPLVIVLIAGIILCISPLFDRKYIFKEDEPQCKSYTAAAAPPTAGKETSTIS